MMKKYWRKNDGNLLVRPLCCLQWLDAEMQKELQAAQRLRRALRLQMDPEITISLQSMLLIFRHRAASAKDYYCF